MSFDGQKHDEPKIMFESKLWGMSCDQLEL